MNLQLNTAEGAQGSSERWVVGEVENELDTKEEATYPQARELSDRRASQHTDVI